MLAEKGVEPQPSHFILQIMAWLAGKHIRWLSRCAQAETLQEPWGESGEQQAKSDVVSSEADGGSILTRASVQRDKIRTFLEKLVDWEEWTRGTCHDWECRRVQQLESSGNSWRSTIPDESWLRCSNMFQEIYAECCEYFPKLRKRRGAKRAH